ncbi:MAG TPA: BlaI/MecI/CopY family transcriptional regulator [Vicinamibacterales bacterium]|nr:BlaI/MecI/CopY family transcriptional regulator [Vicinamibacterales bacterium]
MPPGPTRPTRRLTPLELELMRVLWRRGTATVQEIQQGLPPDKPLAYNTVQTVLTILHRKKHVRRRLKGKAHVYAAISTQQRTATRALREIVDTLFGGSPGDLVMTLMGTHRLTPSEMERVKRVLEDG